jgi:hypothetical protein
VARIHATGAELRAAHHHRCHQDPIQMKMIRKRLLTLTLVTAEVTARQCQVDLSRVEANRVVGIVDTRNTNHLNAIVTTVAPAVLVTLLDMMMRSKWLVY